MLRSTPRGVAIFLALSLPFLRLPSPACAQTLPPGFVLEPVLDGLVDPDFLEFSPDGRLFVCERIQGRLLVAEHDAISDAWVVDPEPYAVFEVPHDGTGVPERHRSSGIRDIAFDPDFESNGYVYVFYMRHDPRHNRVVRITQSSADPNRADAASELLLIDLPFNSTESSGSHNGGALEFGSDGMLYITTGDGWNGGDPVQSLATFTGKILRVAPDGSIPTDNPFFATATGDHRAIHSLGLRNPFTLSRHPTTGELFVQDVKGSDKADIHRVIAGGNYGHQGTAGGGTPVGVWANGGAAGGRVITGGAWVPSGSVWPAEYHDALVTPLWVGGRMSRIVSVDDPTVVAFATGLAIGEASPMSPRFGPDGALYFVRSTYETSSGAVLRLRYDDGPVDPPSGDRIAKYEFDPPEPALDEVTQSSGSLFGDAAFDAEGGYVGGALVLGGTGGGFEVTGLDPSGGTGFAVSLWFRADDFDQPDGRLASQAIGTAEVDHLWMLSTIDDTALRFRLRTSGTTTTLASAVGVVELDTWHHVVANYDGASMRIHLDGALVATGSKSGPVDSGLGIVTAIGDQPSGAGLRPFDGTIDRVEIFDRALSEAEIQARWLGAGAFVRGDANGDGQIDLSDAIGLLALLFASASGGPCLEALDVDDSGTLNIADAVSLLAHLFGGSVTPPAPFPDCGVDPTPPSLGCATSRSGC